MMLRALAVALALLANRAAATEVWLAPLSDVMPTNTGAADYPQFVTDEAAWANVAPHTAVFKIYPYFTGRSPDAELRGLIATLKRENIALALEGRVLSRVFGCDMRPGAGAEATIHLLGRIKRFGGVVAYLAMDEPLKHVTTGPKECRPTLADAARDAAENIRAYRKLFPGLMVGDVEPIGTWPHTETLLADNLAWIRTYEDVAGEKLAFFHADVGWTTDWVGVCAELQRDLAKRHIPFGMIYNGEDLAGSAADWASQARAHFHTFEAGRRPAPAMAVIQSWVRFPDHALPDTDPESLTGVEFDYLRFRGLARQ